MIVKQLWKNPKLRTLPYKIKAALFLNFRSAPGLLLVVLSIFFINTAGFKATYNLHKDYIEVTGEIKNVWIEERGNTDKAPILGYFYEFFTEEGIKNSGIAFGEKVYPQGQRLKIRYNPHHPFYNTAQKLRPAPYTPIHWLLASGIFITGIILIVYGTLLALEKMLYLERGKVFWANRVSKRKHDVSVESQTGTFSDNLLYSYKGSDGQTHYASHIGKKAKYIKKKTLIVTPPSESGRTKFIDFLNNGFNSNEIALENWIKLSLTPLVELGEIVRPIPIKKKLSLRHKLSILASRNQLIIVGLILMLAVISPLAPNQWKSHFALMNGYEFAGGEVIEAWTIKEETEEEWPLYKYEYIFYTSEIGQFKGTGYTQSWLEPGDALTIKFSNQNPYYNQAVNMRNIRTPVSTGYLWLVTLMISIVACVFTFVKSVTAIYIINNGLITQAKRTSIDKTLDFNAVKFYLLSYQFHDDQEKLVYTTVKTSRNNRMSKITTIAFLPNSSKKLVYLGLLPETVEDFILDNWSSGKS